MKLKEQLIFLMVFFVIVFLIMVNSNTLMLTGNVVEEEPPGFHEFYGAVTCLNGNRVLDGKVITAKLSNGVDISASSSTIYLGRYDLVVNGFSSEMASENDTIDFYLGSELLKENILFEYFGETELNLISNDNSNCELANEEIIPEEEVPIKRQCEDNIDNDNDGCIDYPNDPGCNNQEDDSENSVKCVLEPSCENECLMGQKSCVNSISYKVCMNSDPDQCLEWSSTKQCSSGYECREGDCVQIKQKISLYKESFLKWIIPIIIILIILFFIANSVLGIIPKRSERIKAKTRKLTLANRKTIEPYIQSRLRQGYNIKEIRKELIRKGIPVKRVDKILIKYK